MFIFYHVPFWLMFIAFQKGDAAPPPLIDSLGDRMIVPILVDGRVKDILQLLDLQGK